MKSHLETPNEFITKLYKYLPTHGAVLQNFATPSNPDGSPISKLYDMFHFKSVRYLAQIFNLTTIFLCCFLC